MKITNGILPNGVRLIAPTKETKEARKRLEHTFFWNATYNRLFCVLRTNATGLLNAAFSPNDEVFGIHSEPYLSSDAMCLNGYVDCILSDGRRDKWRCIFIVLPINHSCALTVGIVAHECSHAVDFMFDNIGEDNEGSEQRAYAIQWLVDECLTYLKGETKYLSRQ